VSNRAFQLPLVVAALVMFEAQVLSFDPGPVPPPIESWAKSSRDGRFIFVVRLSKLHSDYPKSGLYRNDGSKRLMWEFPKHCSRDAAIASDGVHLIDLEQHASRSDDDAIRFYADGRLIRTWYIRDVLSASWKSERLPGANHKTPWATAAELSEDELTFVVETQEGARLTFEVQSGELIERVSVASRKSIWDISERQVQQLTIVVPFSILALGLGISIGGRILRRRLWKPVGRAPAK